MWSGSCSSWPRFSSCIKGDELGFVSLNAAFVAEIMTNPSAEVFLSVVIPVYNEELNLPSLFPRLYAVLHGLGRTYEVIFTNDGSIDRSIELLRAQHAARPDVTRVIDFNANYGQHMAVLAAFERVRGSIIVTLDADLQN